MFFDGRRVIRLGLDGVSFSSQALGYMIRQDEGFQGPLYVEKNIENTWVSSLSMMWILDILDFHVEIYQFS